MELYEALEQYEVSATGNRVDVLHAPCNQWVKQSMGSFTAEAFINLVNDHDPECEYVD